MTLGQRVRELRGAMTLAQIAQLTGVSVPYLSDIERGRTLPSLHVVALLSDCYEMSLTEFFVGVVIATETAS